MLTDPWFWACCVFAAGWVFERRNHLRQRDMRLRLRCALFGYVDRESIGGFHTRETLRKIEVGDADA